ncbi:hypothetical protein LguiA_034469 [Lonicera macranthoides]
MAPAVLRLFLSLSLLSSQISLTLLSSQIFLSRYSYSSPRRRLFNQSEAFHKFEN